MSTSALVAWPIGSDDEPEWTLDHPAPAHKGRRRRRYTRELVRCPHTEIQHGRELPCGALLWIAKLDDLYDHLREHDQLAYSYSEQQVRDFFTHAKPIAQPGVHTCQHRRCECFLEVPETP